MEVSPHSRRRPQSSEESQRQAIDLDTPTNGPSDNLRDVATGFVDIYQGLTVRQIGILGLFPLGLFGLY